MPELETLQSLHSLVVLDASAAKAKTESQETQKVQSSTKCCLCLMSSLTDGKLAHIHSPDRDPRRLSGEPCQKCMLTD
jgi:hypothetical protein